VKPRHRAYLEQYKKCHGADEIETIQARIMEELESSWNNARKSKGGFIHYFKINLSRRWPIDKTHGLETEDLLVANPNHGMNAEEDDESQKSEISNPVGERSSCSRK
jgi:hypothetical protein